MGLQIGKVINDADYILGGVLCCVMLLCHFIQDSKALKTTENIVAGWFTNWGQYREDGFDFFPNNIIPIIEDLDILYYGFAYFCPNNSMTPVYWNDELDKFANYCTKADSLKPFELFGIEPNDINFINQLILLRNQYNKNLKILISVGGWNFPSSYFSNMVSSQSSRNSFIASVYEFINNNNLDGIDFDWEYPNSTSRISPVEINKNIFKFVNDTGGTTKDFQNYPILLKDLRNFLGNDKLITICGQAGLINVDNGFDLKNISKYVNYINIMTYDYTVSAVNNTKEASKTAPNEPLYSPQYANQYNIPSWNINQTVNGYVLRGVPLSKILIGIAYYGHTWYIPNLNITNINDWGYYGINSIKPNSIGMSNCRNITKYTYGGSAGNYTLQCGFNGYFEIQRAGFLNNAIYDNITKTYISYINKKGNDDWTPANTWINFQGLKTIQSIIKFGKSLGVAGYFGFDLTIDSFDNEQWTFDLTKQMVTCAKQGCDDTDNESDNDETF